MKSRSKVFLLVLFSFSFNFLFSQKTTTLNVSSELEEIDPRKSVIYSLVSLKREHTDLFEKFVACNAAGWYSEFNEAECSILNSCNLMFVDPSFKEIIDIVCKIFYLFDKNVELARRFINACILFQFDWFVSKYSVPKTEDRTVEQNFNFLCHELSLIAEDCSVSRLVIDIGALAK